jgi:hypothetical protein
VKEDLITKVVMEGKKVATMSGDLIISPKEMIGVDMVPIMITPIDHDSNMIIVKVEDIIDHITTEEAIISRLMGITMIIIALLMEEGISMVIVRVDMTDR